MHLVYASLAKVKEVMDMDTTIRPKMRRFGTEEAAHRWLEAQYQVQEPPVLQAETAAHPIQGTIPNRTPPTAPDQEAPVRTYYDPRPYAEIEQELAIDSSRGKEGAAFGKNIISEQDAEDLLSPTDLSEEASKTLRGKILDATALPNLTLPTASEAEESLLASSLMIVATSNGTRDPQVHLPKRTALYTIKSLSALQRLSKQLSKASERAHLNTTGAMTRVFQNAGVPRELSTFRATKCLAFRVSVDTLKFYQELVTHLLEINARLGWTTTLVELQYHADEISGIRTSTNNRTHALLLIYIHLRNASHSKWQSSRLLAARVDAITDPTLSKGDEEESGTGTSVTSELTTSSSTSGTSLCPHCNSTIHPMGTTCPFKRLKRDKARKAAKAYLKKMYEDAIQSVEEE